MADRGRPNMLLHQTFVLATMAHAKHFADTSQLFVGSQQLVPFWIPDGHPGRELAAVLDIKQHAGNEPRNLAGALRRNERAHRSAWEVTDGHEAAFVMEIAHRLQNVDLRSVAAADSERDGAQAAAKLAEQRSLHLSRRKRHQTAPCHSCSGRRAAGGGRIRLSGGGVPPDAASFPQRCPLPPETASFIESEPSW
jgi:hypothetical protein